MDRTRNWFHELLTQSHRNRPVAAPNQRETHARFTYRGSVFRCRWFISRELNARRLWLCALNMNLLLENECKSLTSNKKTSTVYQPERGLDFGTHA
eukprot:gene1310-7938_t